MKSQFIHLVARVHRPLRPFLARDACADLWVRLRKRFPKVLAGMVMPNHLHLDLETTDPRSARDELSIELKAFSQSGFAGQRIWESVPDPQELADPLHLQRHIRYVLLNPCRAQLAMDPLEWEWSTHRDAIGAVADSWLDHALLRKIWGRGERDFATRFHAYVSGDPSVRVEGTALPAKLDLARTVVPLHCVEDAVLQVTRARGSEIRRHGSRVRRLAALLAQQVGGRNQPELSEWLGLGTRGLRKILSLPATPDEQCVLNAARWVLSGGTRFTKR